MRALSNNRALLDEYTLNVEIFDNCALTHTPKFSAVANEIYEYKFTNSLERYTIDLGLYEMASNHCGDSLVYTIIDGGTWAVLDVDRYINISLWSPEITASGNTGTNTIYFELSTNSGVILKRQQFDIERKGCDTEVTHAHVLAYNMSPFDISSGGTTVVYVDHGDTSGVTETRLNLG